jgi:hypothetical protein
MMNHSKSGNINTKYQSIALTRAEKTFYGQNRERRRPLLPTSSHQDAQVKKQSYPLFLKFIIECGK